MTAPLCSKGLHPMAFPNVRARPGRKDQCRACLAGRSASEEKKHRGGAGEVSGWRQHGWLRKKAR
jgi:hypothetical protein